MRWLVLVAACSGANPPPREPAAALTPEQFCERLGVAPPALARCTPAERRLEVVSDAVDQLPTVVAECRKRIALVAQKRVAFDGGAAATCLAAVEAGRRTAPFGEFPGTACYGVVRGLVAAGQPCTADFECADGGRCNHVCVAAPAEHAACDPGEPAWFYEEQRFCRPHFDCTFHPEATAATCERVIAPGEPCTVHSSCALAGRCVDGRCVAPAPVRRVGEVCATYRGRNDLTMALECTPDAYCPTTDQPPEARCTAKQRAGTVCLFNEECLGRCIDGTCTSLCGSG